MITSSARPSTGTPQNLCQSAFENGQKATNARDDLFQMRPNRSYVSRIGSRGFSRSRLSPLLTIELGGLNVWRQSFFIVGGDVLDISIANDIKQKQPRQRINKCPELLEELLDNIPYV